MLVRPGMVVRRLFRAGVAALARGRILTFAFRRIRGRVFRMRISLARTLQAGPENDNDRAQHTEQDVRGRRIVRILMQHGVFSFAGIVGP
jgi:hypothetical protein